MTTNSKADLRDLLAAERTFLAWIRTGVALMGFGFVVERFGLFLQQLQVLQHTPPARPGGLSFWFGTALMVLGALVNIFSSWHHLQLVKQLQRGSDVTPRSSLPAVLIALLLASLGLAMTIYLFSVKV